MKQCSIFDIDNASVEVIKHNRYVISVDGASRNNPGVSGIGIVIIRNDKLVLKQGFFIGIKTNNQAEYLAIIVALYILKSHWQQDDTVVVRSDSQLIINQLRGVYAVRNDELKKMHHLANMLIKSMKVFCVHVMREQNSLADEMANYGVDERVMIPDEIISFLNIQGINL